MEVGVGDSLGLFMTSEILAREGGVMERGPSITSCLHLYLETPMKLVRWLQSEAMPFRTRSDEDVGVGQQAGGVDSVVCNDWRPTGELQERKM